MTGFRSAAGEFLAHRRIAVAGVSRDPKQAANAVYRRLKKEGYEVFPVNPAAEVVEGDRCYGSVAAIPGGVEAVFVATHPDVAADVARECAGLGIRRIWFHRSFGGGSVSPAAVEVCEREGLLALHGGCPLMVLEPVDIGHRCIRWLLGTTGKLPAGPA